MVEDLLPGSLYLSTWHIRARPVVLVIKRPSQAITRQALNYYELLKV